MLSDQSNPDMLSTSPGCNQSTAQIIGMSSNYNPNREQGAIPNDGQIL